MNPPPPRLPAPGQVTASANAVATAASTALPPFFKISMPTLDAIGSTDTTAAFGYDDAGPSGLARYTDTENVINSTTVVSIHRIVHTQPQSGEKLIENITTLVRPRVQFQEIYVRVRTACQEEGVKDIDEHTSSFGI